MARKRLVIPPLIAEAMAFMQELMPAIIASDNEEGALKALRETFARHPDALTNPIVRLTFGVGLEMIKLGNANVITGPEMRVLRIKRNIMQAELARELGVSGPYISRMESGKAPIPGKYAPKIRSFLDSRKPKKGNAA